MCTLTRIEAVAKTSVFGHVNPELLFVVVSGVSTLSSSRTHMSFCAGEQISLFYVSTTTSTTIRNNAHGMLENILQHSQLV